MRVVETLVHVGGAVMRIGDIHRQVSGAGGPVRGERGLVSGSVVPVRVVLVAVRVLRRSVARGVVADGDVFRLERVAKALLSERDLPQIIAGGTPSVVAALL